MYTPGLADAYTYIHACTPLDLHSPWPRAFVYGPGLAHTCMHVHMHSYTHMHAPEFAHTGRRTHTPGLVHTLHARTPGLAHSCTRLYTPGLQSPPPIRACPAVPGAVRAHCKEPAAPHRGARSCPEPVLAGLMGAGGPQMPSPTSGARRGDPGKWDASMGRASRRGGGMSLSGLSSGREWGERGGVRAAWSYPHCPGARAGEANG